MTEQENRTNPDIVKELAIWFRQQGISPLPIPLYPGTVEEALAEYDGNRLKDIVEGSRSLSKEAIRKTVQLWVVGLLAQVSQLQERWRWEDRNIRFDRSYATIAPLVDDEEFKNNAKLLTGDELVEAVENRLAERLHDDGSTDAYEKVREQIQETLFDRLVTHTLELGFELLNSIERDETTATLLALEFSSSVHRLHLELFRNSLVAGAGTIAGGREGNRKVHGSPDKQDERRSNYRATFKQFRGEDSRASRTKILKRVAQKFGVSYKTIDNHTKDMR